jgi:hypothetical protein
MESKKYFVFLAVINPSKIKGILGINKVDYSAHLLFVIIRCDILTGVSNRIPGRYGNLAAQFLGKS